MVQYLGTLEKIKKFKKSEFFLKVPNLGTLASDACCMFDSKEKIKLYGIVNCHLLSQLGISGHHWDGCLVCACISASVPIVCDKEVCVVVNKTLR